jgi:hypothetical protein
MRALFRAFNIPSLAVARCNSDLAQYSNTPALRVAGFEDEDDDEDENDFDAPSALRRYVFSFLGLRKASALADC